MSQIDERDSIVTKIYAHFSFLFERGFTIIDVTYNRHSIFQVTLEAECRIVIESDRDGEITLLFAKQGTSIDEKGWFTLEVLIYYLSNKKHYIGGYFGSLKETDQQLSRFSGFLNTYLDKIIDLFTGGRFDKYTSELLQLRQTVDNLLYKEYLEKKH